MTAICLIFLIFIVGIICWPLMHLAQIIGIVNQDMYSTIILFSIISIIISLLEAKNFKKYLTGFFLCIIRHIPLIVFYSKAIIYISNSQSLFDIALLFIAILANIISSAIYWLSLPNNNERISITVLYTVIEIIILVLACII